MVTGSKQGPVVEVVGEEMLKYLQDFFKTSKPVDAKKEVLKEEEPAPYDFRLEFKRFGGWTACYSFVLMRSCNVDAFGKGIGQHGVPHHWHYVRCCSILFTLKY